MPARRQLRPTDGVQTRFVGCAPAVDALFLPDISARLCIMATTVDHPAAIMKPPSVTKRLRPLALAVSLLSAGPLPPGWAAPALTPSWVSFLGTRGEGYQEESALAAALDPQGHPLVAWTTSTGEIPLLRRYGPPEGGDLSVLTKLSPAGDRVLYHVGFPWTTIRAVATDAAGQIYLAGDTALPPEQFPLVNAAQPQWGGHRDAFLAKLSADGTQLLYCTYLGGSALELGTDLAVDSEGYAHLTGWTTSTNFPVTAGAVQPAAGGSFDAFVAKLAPDGSQFTYATYLGGPGRESGASIAADAQGRAIVVGTTTSVAFGAGVPTAAWGTTALRTAYVARLRADGGALETLALLGGSGHDYGAAVAVDTQGAIYVLGRTESPDFPATPGSLRSTSQGPGAAADAFLAKLDPAGSALIYATYLGGSQDELPLRWVYSGPFDLDGEVVDDYQRLERGGLAVDAASQAYVTGSTESPDFAPDQAANLSAGTWNPETILAKINATATAYLHVSYLGATSGDWAWDLALRGEDDVLVVGSTQISLQPPHFPSTPGAFQTGYGGSISDAFVARYGPPPGPPTNDTFASRIELPGTLLTVRADHTSASREPGEPVPDPRAAGRTLWWSWTAPAAGRCLLATDRTREPSILAVYTGATLATLAPVAVSADSGDGAPGRRLTVPVEAGQVLQIMTDGRDGASGEVALSLAFSAPPNDDLAQRLPVTGFPLTLTGSNRHATLEAGEPMHELFGRHSIWWSWTAPSTRAVRITTEGSDFFALTTVYSQPGDGELRRLAGGQGSDPEGFTFLAVEGQSYEIAVDGYTDESGHVVLNLLPGVPPANDDFANALVLAGFNVQVQGTNTTATREPGEWLPGQVTPGPTEVTGGRTLWYTWVAPTNGYLRVVTESEQVETILAVYTGNQVTQLEPVAVGSDRPGLASEAYFGVQQGTTYRIQVDTTRWSPPGILELSLNLVQPPEIVAGSFQRQGDGHVSFAVRGVAEHVYRLQVSADLSEWTVMDLDYQGTEFTVEDRPPAGTVRRFYRLVDVTPSGG